MVRPRVCLSLTASNLWPVGWLAREAVRIHDGVFVEIVAKKKGCMLCDLAIGILEEVSPEFPDGLLRWEVVDVSDREGVRRHKELAHICGRTPPVPSIVINEKISFDHIPDMEALAGAVRAAARPSG